MLMFLLITQVTVEAADALGALHLKVYKGDGHQKLPTSYGLRDLWELPLIPEL